MPLSVRNSLTAIVILLAYDKYHWSNAATCNYSNHFAVEADCEETEAKLLANKTGFRYITRVFDEEKIYYFIHPNISKCSENASKDHIKCLLKDPRVRWVEQQAYREQIIRRSIHNFHVLHDKQIELPSWYKPSANAEYLRVPVSVVKKDGIPNPASFLKFNDPLYNDQWYLHNEGQTGADPGNDLNVIPVWQAGITGRGITLSVLDDGLQYTNPDIKDNYEPDVSYDLVDFEKKAHDPMPDGKPENGHGTYCAGVIAAVANNSFCGVGVAYHAKVGGIRILDGPVTDLQEALALSLALKKVDVYSASWGPQDDGKHCTGPGVLAARALKRGIEQGRNGKGVIYVWAVGNGGASQDNCNMDGYVSNIYTLAVTALTDGGLSAYYSEPCACIIASTFVGGLHDLPRADEEDSFAKDFQRIKVVVPELDGKCQESFQGTSAAAPMAAGLIALLLEANPALTWRDVKHVIIETSRIPNGRESGWQINGAGYHFHLMYGMGAMDAGRMVALGQVWNNVGPLQTWIIHTNGLARPILASRNSTLSFVVSDLHSESASSQVNFLEYVAVCLSIDHPRRGDLEIFVRSPAGTESQVLTIRPNDDDKRGLDQWLFTSVHFWGENPRGNWSVWVRDVTKMANGSSGEHVTGTMEICSVTLYGTLASWQMVHVFDMARFGKSFWPNTTYLTSISQAEKALSGTVKIKNVNPQQLVKNDSQTASKPRLPSKHLSSANHTPEVIATNFGQNTNKQSSRYAKHKEVDAKLHPVIILERTLSPKNSDDQRKERLPPPPPVRKSSNSGDQMFQRFNSNDNSKIGPVFDFPSTDNSHLEKSKLAAKYALDAPVANEHYNTVYDSSQQEKLDDQAMIGETQDGSEFDYYDNKQTQDLEKLGRILHLVEMVVHKEPQLGSAYENGEDIRID